MTSGKYLLSNKGHRFLIVDDDPYASVILSEWLVTEGYECDIATSACQAMGMLAVEEYSLLIAASDRMPRISGLELLALTRTRMPEVATILVTEIGNRNLAIEALECGVFTCVYKPLVKREIVVCVANALKHKHFVNKQLTDIQLCCLN